LGEDDGATGSVREALEHLNCRIGPPVCLPGADTDPGMDPSTGSRPTSASPWRL